MNRRPTRDYVLCALVAALTAVGAYITIPMFGPIPFTLQVLFVLLSGLVLGARLGALSMLVYLALGLIAPVYAGGASGFGTLIGPAGGYLWGFVLAAAVVGYVTERRRPRGIVGLTAVSLLGLLPIYLLGAVWLAIELQTTSVEVVVWGGVVQFLPLDVVKAVLAAVVARALCAAAIGLPAFSRVPPKRSAGPIN
jgi:biotin transport system substrate-specific component